MKKEVVKIRIMVKNKEKIFRLSRFMGRFNKNNDHCHDLEKEIKEYYGHHI